MPDLMKLWTPAPDMLAGAFERCGVDIRIVGGAVRDAIGGRKHKDVDLATPATPIEMLRLGERLGLRTVPLLAEAEARPSEWEKGGLKHGTVPFVMDGPDGPEMVEVTTLRADVETDGRHARVAFVRDFETDAARRDFTFNAMSVDRRGRLFDCFGGVSDLQSGIVRFVGSADQRIREDYLRILRFFRFRGRYGSPDGGLLDLGPEDGATFDAIRRNRAGMGRISGERIWSEMRQILGSGPSFLQLKAMHLTGVTDAVGLPFGHESRRDACVQAYGAACCGAHPAMVLGLLLRPTARDAEPRVRPCDIQERWKMSGGDREFAEFAFTHWHMADAPYSAFLDLALLPRARRDLLGSLLAAFGRSTDAAAILMPLPEFPVRGADLVARGISPGPAVGQALSRLHGAWKDGGYLATAEELLELEPPTVVTSDSGPQK